MWAFDNETDFGVGGAWFYLPNGRLTWTVVCKRRYAVNPDGSLHALAVGLEPLRAPIFRHEPTRSSLIHDAEVTPPLRTATDVLVLGRVHAPHTEAVSVLSAGFSVGSLRKEVAVFGTRYWDGGKITPPEPFVQLPITYECAFGGCCITAQGPVVDWRNPVGTGFAVSSKAARGMRLPNLEHLHQMIEHWSDRPPPMGLGPLPAHWKPRCDYAGSFNAQWQSARAPRPPDDQAAGYFQCAPADQQVAGFLKGGEDIRLFHLTPGQRQRLILPKVEFEIASERFGGQLLSHSPVTIQRVTLEPAMDGQSDMGCLTMLWQSTLTSEADPDQLKVTRIKLVNEQLASTPTRSGSRKARIARAGDVR